MDSGTRRVTESRLIDHDGLVREGDFLLHEDGSFSVSNGDEDVVRNHRWERSPDYKIPPKLAYTPPNDTQQEYGGRYGPDGLASN